MKRQIEHDELNWRENSHPFDHVWESSDRTRLVDIDTQKRAKYDQPRAMQSVTWLSSTFFYLILFSR